MAEQIFSRQPPPRRQPELGRSPPLVSSRTQTAAFFIIVTVLVVAASMMMFSTFMLYDDEGYVLLSLRNFAEHGHLYGTVYTQYGPFPFVLYTAFHALGMPLTHAAGRWIAIAAWSGTALFSGALVMHATKSAVARLAVVAAVFVYLWIMVSEPTHPGGLAAIMIAVMAALGHRWISTDRVSRWGLLFGAGTAAVLLTKINLGVFAGFMGLAWWLLHHESPFLRKWAPWGLGLSVAVLPLALMRALLGVDWVKTYALVFACSGLATIGAVTVASSPRVGWSALRASGAAALLIASGVLGTIYLRGTTFAELLEGMLFGPLRHPANFSLKFPWPTGTTLFALSSLVLCGATWILRRRGSNLADPLVAWLRLVASVALAVTLARFPTISADNLVFAFSAPCLWFFLWPLPGETPSLLAAKNWVGLLFLGQFLHPFPVPGSQIAWGTFLALPLAALGAWPAARWIGNHPRLQGTQAPRVGLGLQLLVSVFAIMTAGRLVQVGNRYLEGRNLDLLGAGPLRLPDNATALYRLLVANGLAHSDILFSLPGMFSLNLWSGIPTPTLANVTHWFSLLNEDQQQAIIRQLESHPRACIVIQRGHIDFLRMRHLTPTGALYNFVSRNYEPAFTVDGFEFCVRKGRRIAPLLTAEVLRRDSSAAPSAADPENALLHLWLSLPPGASVASVALADMNGSATAPLLLVGQKTRIEVTPINLTGDPIGPPQACQFPFTLHGPSKITFYFDGAGRAFRPEETLVVVRDEQGRELALVRILP